MQPDNRTILSEMLLAQSAAAGAFADVANRYTSLMADVYRVSIATLGYGLQHKGEDAGASLPGTGSGLGGELLPWSADVYRAMAGLPRVAMMSFLSRSDGLRGRRGAGSS
jgi:hypothetical protein